MKLSWKTLDEEYVHSLVDAAGMWTGIAAHGQNNERERLRWEVRLERGPKGGDRNDPVGRFATLREAKAAAERYYVSKLEPTLPQRTGQHNPNGTEG